MCHKACKQPGERQEAMNCQELDADCNDCKFFQRTPQEKVWYPMFVETAPTENKFVMVGNCLKFNNRTYGHPKTWTGHQCFEHRRKI